MNDRYNPEIGFSPDDRHFGENIVSSPKSYDCELDMCKDLLKMSQKHEGEFYRLMCVKYANHIKKLEKK